jgi:hypothetical protein
MQARPHHLLPLLLLLGLHPYHLLLFLLLLR